MMENELDMWDIEFLPYDISPVWDDIGIRATLSQDYDTAIGFRCLCKAIFIFLQGRKKIAPELSVEVNGVTESKD